MPSSYLKPADYLTFGVPNTNAMQVMQASVLIDAYLSRPAGLVYVPDASGNPCYMLALATELALTAGSGFGPGTGVKVAATGPLAMLQVGDCVVLDRTSSTLAESVQVTAVDTTAMTVTFGKVQYAHATACAIETGWLIKEKRYVPKGRTQVVLANAPVARVVGGTGRYGYGRRGDSAGYEMDSFNLLATMSHFGGPPAWEIWPADVSNGINPATGELWVPAGVMLAYYSEVMVRYVAGYTYASLPTEVKLACAQLITSLVNNPVMGNVKAMKAGDTAITQFAATVINDDVKSMLSPWRARMFA